MSAKKRLKEYLEIKGIKASQFYKDTGLSNGYLDKGNDIQSNKLAIIKNVYLDLNLEWLIMGTVSEPTNDNEGTSPVLHASTEEYGSKDPYKKESISDGIAENESVKKEVFEELKQTYIRLLCEKDSLIAEKDLLIKEKNERIKLMEKQINLLNHLFNEKLKDQPPFP